MFLVLTMVVFDLGCYNQGGGKDLTRCQFLLRHIWVNVELHSKFGICGYHDLLQL